MLLVGIDRPPPRGATSLQIRFALAVSTLLLASAAFAIGTAARSPAPDPIQTPQGVPVGVEHSPAGAVVAADEYVASEQATLERDQARFAALVAQDYAGPLQASALAAADSDRKRDPLGMRLWADGGESLTTIGAHRLDRYGGDTAQVTLWVGQVLWGPGQQPAQVWGLSRVTLVWRAGQWKVTTMDGLAEPAPAPAQLPQASSGDDTSEVFSSELDGFTPVNYGSAQ